MKFIEAAEIYCREQNKLEEFKGLYSRYRTFNSVKDSTWMALCDIFGTETADLIETASTNTHTG